jgi:hypothetical protein
VIYRYLARTFPLFLQTCNTFPGFSTADGAASRAARDTLLGAFPAKGDSGALSAPTQLRQHGIARRAA